jgi:succinate-semialdehyde dehydrogenase/glutarate-semialdehyde dehydrogenase
MALRSVNPSDGVLLAEYDELAPDEVVDVIEAVAGAFRDWRETDWQERSALLGLVAGVLRDRRRELADLMAREMGKPLREGRGEVDKCAWVCEYYAAHAQGFLCDQEIEADARRSFVAFRPLGVVLAVMPWNFPLWQVFRFAAPSLMAGNTALLKHASNVSGCAIAIESVFRAAGLPNDVFRTILVGRDRVPAVIEHPSVSAVTLTGSTEAGRLVASQAGAALKKTVLELGGSDPYLILADADLDATVEQCVNGRLVNAGQSCISAKRLIVVDTVSAAFQEKFIALMAEKTMGDPFDEASDIGPLARHDLRDELHVQVQRSVAAGARLDLGGKVPDSAGAFYPPTVLSGVGPGMAAYSEELFGPVAVIISARDEEEALRIANDSAFGLGAAVFSRDVERATALARDRLDAGCCFVNDVVRSDPRLPFGGVKQSGYGRELGRFGIQEFVNIKTVWVA